MYWPYAFSSFFVNFIIFGDRFCAENMAWPGFENIKNYEYAPFRSDERSSRSGFHTLQSITAVGSGGIFGKGWLQGTQTQLAFIPERSTDFVFSGYAEEFGFFGSLLILLYAGITLRGLWISIGAPTDFARLLGGTLSMMTFTYACVNIGMVTGVLPVVGVLSLDVIRWNCLNYAWYRSRAIDEHRKR